MAQMRLFEFCKKNNFELSDFIANEVKPERNVSKTIVFHGSKEGIVGDVTPSSRESCDSGKGFYIGTDSLQPLTLICNEEKPVFYTMEFDLTGLKVFDIDIDLEWALLIAFYHGYMDEVKDSIIYNKYKKCGSWV